MASLRFTILGCGSSAGVPRVGGDWGQCDPREPRNRRRRCSVLLTRDGLRESDMRLYLAHILCNVGVYRGGCTLYVEHGTLSAAGIVGVSVTGDGTSGNPLILAGADLAEVKPEFR